MKKFTRVMLILSGVLATIGLVCMLVAFGMGLTTDTLGRIFRDGRFSFDSGDLKISFGEDTEEDLSGDFESGITITEGTTGEVTYHVEELCQNVDIEFGAGLLTVYYADVENIQITKKNIPNLKVKVKNGKLVIREENEINVDLDDIEDRSLCIILPSNTEFEEVDLEIGASKADIHDILAKEISINVGAGEAEISHVTTGTFDLEVGAGQATVAQLTVDKLNVEAGIGQATIAVNGVEEEYNYAVECGIGRVEIGSYSYGGLGAMKSVYNHELTKEINAECGIGEIIVKFIE